MQAEQVDLQVRQATDHQPASKMEHSISSEVLNDLNHSEHFKTFQISGLQRKLTCI